ncbi:Spc98 family-domain-containing protein [Glomus cerebriforme]|uniref:Spc98 family-domain-containing protein n=1 Tax=Glomus cerebriforme TaxID=658196 RepID=A0A397T0A7_9GLOM|nr:Spc98 family-domain-containing protein [Glomus cerebriforme]
MINEGELLLNEESLPEISVPDTRAILFGILDQDISLNLDKDSFHIPELPIRPIDVLLDSLPVPNPQFIFKQPKDSRKSSIDDEETESTQASDHLVPEEKTIWERVTNLDKKQGQILSWESTGTLKSQQNQTSPYLTESDVSIFESVYHSHFHHSYGYNNFSMPHEVLTQDILNLIIGTQSKTFSYNESSKKFISNFLNLRISGCSSKSVNKMLRRFLNIGSHIRRLENVAEKCMKSARLYGLTGVAFGRSLSSFITFVRTSIVAMAETITEQDQIKIIRLYHIVNDVSLVIGRIAAFCRCDVEDSKMLELTENQKEQLEREGFYIPFGSNILSELYTAVESIDTVRTPLLKSVLLTFLEQSSYPFFHMLNSWLGIGSSSSHVSLPLELQKGDFLDPYEEFFIVNFEVDSNYVKYNGDEFWQSGIHVSNDHPLPAFINVELARDVLEAGKSLRLLRDCRPDHPLCHSCVILDQTTGKQAYDIKMKWLFIQGDIDDMKEQLQNYSKDMTIAIVVQDEHRKAEIVRIRERYQKKMSKRKRDAELQLNQKKELARIEVDERSKKKTEWKKSVEKYLAEKKLSISRTTSNLQKPTIIIPPLEKSRDTPVFVESPQTSHKDFEPDKVISMNQKETFEENDSVRAHDILNIENLYSKHQTDVFDFALSSSTNDNPTTALIERLLQVQSSNSSYAHKEYILPLKAITELVVRQTLLCHCRLINASILSIFFNDLDLRAYLNVVRDFMLMGNGTFVSGLVDALFNDNVDLGEDFFPANSSLGMGIGLGIRLNSRQTWPPVGIEWRMALKAVIVETILLEKKNLENEDSHAIDAWGKVNDLDNMLMFGIHNYEESEVCNDPNALEALDFLYLDFKPPYPINVIISPNSLSKYNRLFTFLLRVLRMGTVTRHIYRLAHERYLYDDEEEAAEYNVLVQKFRFEAQQFVIALHGYVFDVAISTTWALFMKRLNKIAKESEFELPREHLWGRGSTSDTFSLFDGQSDVFSVGNVDEFEEDEDDDGMGEGVKDLESLRSYHEHVLDRMLFQCLLKKKQEAVMKVLNGIFTVILAFANKLQQKRSRIIRLQKRQEYWNSIKDLYGKFRLYTAMLVKILMALDEKGGGKMGMGMKRTSINPEGESDSFDSGRSYHDKVDNQSGGGFLQEFLLRVDFNGFYASIVAKELSKRK